MEMIVLFGLFCCCAAAVTTITMAVVVAMTILGCGF